MDSVQTRWRQRDTVNMCQRERERMMSASPWRSSCILPASSPSISHPHIGLWCVYKYLYFCVVSVESKRCFLTDWSVWLVELSMENKRRVRLFCWNNLIIIRRQSWPSKYFTVPNSLNERICNYWTKQDVPQFLTIFWHFDNWAIHPWGRLLSKYFNTDEVWLIVVDLKRVKTQSILTVSILIEKAKRILLLPPWCLFQDIAVVKCFLGPLFSMFLLLSDPVSQSSTSSAQDMVLSLQWFEIYFWLACHFLLEPVYVLASHDHLYCPEHEGT